MKKIADRIREEITIKLAPGEKLCSVGQLHSGSLFAYALSMNFGLLGALLFPISHWFGGVTEKNLILMPVDRISGKPQQDKACIVPLQRVQITGDRITFQRQDGSQAESLRVMNLSKMLSGLDSAEFLAAIRK